MRLSLIDVSEHLNLLISFVKQRSHSLCLSFVRVDDIGPAPLVSAFIYEYKVKAKHQSQQDGCTVAHYKGNEARGISWRLSGIKELRPNNITCTSGNKILFRLLK